MERRYDVVIIGAGHNGLVCAAYLARAGRRVLVLEGRSEVGGAAVTGELAPGFKVSSCAHLLYALHPKVQRELELHRYGFAYARADIPTVALADDGRHLTITAGSLASSSAVKDLSSYSLFRKKITSYAMILKSFLEEVPPRLGTRDRADLVALAKLAWRIRRLGQRDMREFLRIVGMNIADLLEECFETDLLRGALAWDAVLGSNLGPRSPGSVFTYLYRVAGESDDGGMGYPRGGMGAVTASLAAAARSAGTELRTGTPVSRVLLQAERVSGVRLETGEEVVAPVVVSNADPRRSFLSLVGSENLDTGFARRVRHIRTKGTVAKLNLALAHLPEIPGVAAEVLGGRLLIAPAIDYLERAFNPTKYGEYSTAPAMEITVPSVHDASLAPAGKHVMSVVVQYAPCDLKVGWDQARDEFAEIVIRQISRYAPGLADHIEAWQLITPMDLERDFHITGGHWHHGELAFDQFMMMRPVPGACQYSTPIPGFYLCGAGAHPGGGVMGAAGMNAARQVLKMESET